MNYDDLYFINSYERNNHHAIRLKDNLISLGIKNKNIKIINGYDSYTPQHIDRFFKSIGEKKEYLQIDYSITKIVEHHSLDLNKIRKNPKNKYFKILKQ